MDFKDDTQNIIAHTKLNLLQSLKKKSRTEEEMN